MFMKYFTPLFFLFLFNFFAFSQTADRVLATANGVKITVAELPGDVGSEYLNAPKSLAEFRRNLLNEQISDTLLEIGAAAKNRTVEKFLAESITEKVKDPSNEEIQSIYEINRDRIGNKTFEEVRPQIVAFLRSEPEKKLLDSLMDELKTANKIVNLKDAGLTSFKDLDVLATVGSRKITFKDFLNKNRAKIADFEEAQYESVFSAVEEALYSSLITIEANALEIAPYELIAREITDKLREYSDEERENLESVLRNRLFSKYSAKILLTAPAPFVQTISVDDDPFEGSANAKVTVVMFSDFQCPTCASVHPVLKRVISRYGSGVRLVVRDFPLVNIHENAFRAALAANAANAQGKFFEYIDLLYKNHKDLSEKALIGFARELGLNVERFELDLKSGKFVEEVRKDMEDGNLYGVSGTPTIFVNGVKVRLLSEKSFRDAIEGALKK